MGEIHVAPPKKRWKDEPLKWLPMVSKWCEADVATIHGILRGTFLGSPVFGTLVTNLGN